MGKTTRVVVCGMKSVGKTALLEQLVYGNVTPKTEIHTTIEDIYVANIETDKGAKEKVRFYDTAGLEPLQSSSNNQQLARHYLGFADGYVLVYDTAKPESLDVLLPLKKDIEKNKDKKEIITIVIGNRTKPDIEQRILENTASKAANWCAREKLKHFEVNVMDRPSLYEAFVYLSSRLNPPQNKSTFPQLSMGRKTGKAEST
ncbi:NF-kappa-B inhibitor-interacting Ras-like protein [Nasonia vitripennis]|uniref:NF-kappa-B inhibitor-interacting Ras-like protein n=1 Tax=Nasonia vitripennis TaxID=7425 RepID=A0A7M7H7Q3_NASVI|nr:NF-kappa-B inhibitor-interacting Ras-like protein [Nasonia vitripennis]XP_008203181.1 NF-kappa-B inhibitor-interacting Ras-like protein [Nasonia vitripennis]XP_008203183.1 NF-kappa-B inhibitor-interacting Ras-like protein [Nasonia vitripennis]XP_032457697.1 NF-kappa-B inhibitor-interacting Ras-like protein [Nasonia vitripennis]